MTLDVDGLGPTLFCHATPRNDTEVALVDSALARWAEVLAGRPKQTVVLGHTHMPFARLANRVLVVNPGSVGMPYGRGGAHWAVLGPGVELRRSTYDVQAACAVLRTGGYPGVEEWLDAYVRRTFGDDEALAVSARATAARPEAGPRGCRTGGQPETGSRSGSGAGRSRARPSTSSLRQPGQPARQPPGRAAEQGQRRGTTTIRTTIASKRIAQGQREARSA